MPWDATQHAGFTIGEPWLPLGADAAARNVAAQQQDPASILSLYRALLALRREDPVLTRGSYRPVRAKDGVLSYRRELDDQQVLIVLNLEPRAQQVEAPAGEIVLSTHLDRTGERIEGTLSVRPDEGVIVRLAG